MEDASLSFVSKRFLVKHRLLRRSSLRVAVQFFYYTFSSLISSFLTNPLLVNFLFSWISSSCEFSLLVNFLFSWISSSCDSFLFIISPLVYDLFSLFCGLFCLLLIIYWTFAFNKWKLSQASARTILPYSLNRRLRCLRQLNQRLWIFAATCRCLEMCIFFTYIKKTAKNSYCLHNCLREQRIVCIFASSKG